MAIPASAPAGRLVKGRVPGLSRRRPRAVRHPVPHHPGRRRRCAYQPL